MTTEITFKLFHDSDQLNPIHITGSLPEMIVYVRNTINIPENWYIEEYHNAEAKHMCSAKYLVENYAYKPIPLTLKDIE